MRNHRWILLPVLLLLLTLCACGGRGADAAVSGGESYEILDTGAGREGTEQEETAKAEEKKDKEKSGESEKSGETASSAQTSTAPASPSSSQRSTAPAGVVDGVKYSKVELGMTYDEVKEIMGSGGEKVSSSEINGYTMATYQWLNAEETGTAAVAFKNGKVSTKMQMNVAKTDPVATKAKYDKVKTGMTYPEVREIFGTDGVVTYMDSDDDFGYEYVEYMWNGPDDSFVQVVFDDGKVSLTNESGLS